MDLASIAIWDKNKIVIAVSTVLWVGYLTSMIQGRSFSLFSPVDECSSLRIWFGISYLGGKLNSDLFLTSGAYLFVAPLFMDMVSCA